MSIERRRLAQWRVAALLAATAPLLTGCLIPENRQDAAHLADVDRPSLKAAKQALSQGQAETALAIAQGVLSQEPKNVAALVSAGDANVTMNNRRSAESEYRAALAVQPNYVPARLGLGKLKLRDDAHEAELQFRAIVDSFPHNAAARTDLGVALDLQEKHAEAQAQYQAALAINPEMTSTRVDLGLSLALSGNPAKAEQILRDATDAAAVPPKVRADYAVAQIMAGQPKDAAVTLSADLTPAEVKASVDEMAALLPQKNPAQK